MKVTCLKLEPGGAMRPESEAAAVAAWRAGEGTRWIDLASESAEPVVKWLAALGLDPGLVDLMQVGADETRILPLAGSVFFAYPVPAGDQAREHDHFGCLCLERLVITMHDEAGGSLRLDDAMVGRFKLPEPTTAGVVAALALVHSSRLRRHVATLRGAGDSLADRTDSSPQSVRLEEILALKRRVLALGGVVEEELAVLEVLKVSRQAALPLSQIGETFQVAVENMRATDRTVDRLDRRLGELQGRHEALQQEKTNRRLGQLTMISALFMPLTLIAGIYGMNFEFMPELHFRYGYPAALAGMALIAAGTSWYFRSRWWPK